MNLLCKIKEFLVPSKVDFDKELLAKNDVLRRLEEGQDRLERALDETLEILKEREDDR